MVDEQMTLGRRRHLIFLTQMLDEAHMFLRNFGHRRRVIIAVDGHRWQQYVEPERPPFAHFPEQACVLDDPLRQVVGGTVHAITAGATHRRGDFKAVGEREDRNVDAQALAERGAKGNLALGCDCHAVSFNG